MAEPSEKQQINRLIGLKAIAEYLGRSERTVCRYIARHSLPVVRVGGLLETTTEELDKWRKNRL